MIFLNKIIPEKQRKLNKIALVIIIIYNKIKN